MQSEIRSLSTDDCNRTKNMLRVFVGTRLFAVDVYDVVRVKQADHRRCVILAHSPMRLGLAHCSISGLRTSGVWYVSAEPVRLLLVSESVGRQQPMTVNRYPLLEKAISASSTRHLLKLSLVNQES